MSTTTPSVERSLNICSLSNGDSSFGNARSSSSSAESHETRRSPCPDPTFELNSRVSLPYDWQQCLHLKTGEIFYVNLRNGEKANSDPRRRVKEEVSREEEEEEVVFTEDDSSYADSDESVSESSLCSSAATGGRNKHAGENNSVLVVAGCRICFMYIMVSKQDSCCPKCNGQLVHFER